MDDYFFLPLYNFLAIYQLLLDTNHSIIDDFFRFLKKFFFFTKSGDLMLFDGSLRTNYNFFLFDFKNLFSFDELS